ncbi:MAG TPA: RNA methyltransferase [Acidimicrobiales bacterium]
MEGATLLGEALDAGAPVESVYVAPRPAGDPEPPEVARAWQAGVRVHDLGPGVLERVAGTVTPQPVLAVVGMVDGGLEALAASGPVVVCVDVRDPGNLGTVLRSAEAAGAAGVICCDGTVDVYNPKCVRASAGALFHVPVVAGGSAVSVLAALAASGRRRLGAAVGSGEPYTSADLAGPVALVLGNEAGGLPAEVAPELDGYVHIPIEGRSESLNVGMACAVLCFEAARQRHLAATVTAAVDR